MLERLSALAILPKAKHMAALRLTKDEYRALMRRKSVLDVVNTLKNHPYFSKTLSGLSSTNPHREQLEQALSKDLFYKYESLMRYCFRRDHFGGYFLVRSEINEILQKLRLMSLGFSQQYIAQMPGFLVSKTKLDLMAIAQATSLQELYKILHFTQYAKTMQGIVTQGEGNINYIECEHAFEAYYYEYVLNKIDKELSKNAAKDTRELFCCQAEIYNIDMLFRTKAFYPTLFTTKQLQNNLLPVYGVLNKKVLFALAATNSLEDFFKMYNTTRAADVYGALSDNFERQTGAKPYRHLYKKAQRLIHFSSSPETVLAALLCLAEIERSNIVTVVEAVRYGLEPEKTERFLKFC